MPHKTPIQIRFKDVDALGHVNNANHATYFEMGRISYFDDVIGTNIDWETEGMILKFQSIEYKKPIFQKDKIHVKTRFVKSGTTSFELHCSIVREESDGSETEMATGVTVLVCFNYKEQKPVPVPPLWIERMQASDL